MITSRMEDLVFDESKTLDVYERVYIPVSEELDREVCLDESRAEKYDNWFFTNGDIYYLKQCGLHALLSELLGEQISKYMSLPTIEYKVARENGKILGLLSKSFKLPNVVYRDAITLDRKEIKIIKDCVREKNFVYDSKFKKDLITYLLSNYFIDLKDRFANTYIIENGKYSFAISPIYDYESAFIDAESQIYEDPMITWLFVPESVEYLMENNEYFRYVYNKLMNMSFEELISLVETEKGITYPDDYKELYLGFESKRKEYMRSLVK